jgi:O-antigen ligase
LLFGGVYILALGQGRTTIVAVVAALLTLALGSRAFSRCRRRGLITVAVVTAAVGASIAYIAFVDSTFAGRTSIWHFYARAAQLHPVFGIGDSGVRDVLESITFNTTHVVHDHAHSVLLDGFVRWGGVWLLVSVFILTMAVLASVRTLRFGEPLPLALVIFVLVSGSIETLYSWDYLTVSMLTLTWAVMAGDQILPHEEGVRAFN